MRAVILILVIIIVAIIAAIATGFLDINQIRGGKTPEVSATGNGVVAKGGQAPAFDVETGAELWKGQLPAGGQAMPMTYRLRSGGKQFVVIAAGGHGKLGTTLGDSVVAFALP